jgi:thiol-disulfide isomerase/thioredoxin
VTYRVNNRALIFLFGFAVAIAEAQTDEPTATKASGRVVEGKIVTAGSKPVEGAKVLFGEHGRGMGFVDGATATTDAQGRYRADLVKLAWSTGPIRALVLAPGYKAPDRKIDAGTGTASANFELVAQPWQETQVRMQDSAGRPVAGVEINCSVGRLIVERYKTDALGSCRIGMARGLGMRLSAEPKGARPIEAFFNGGKDDPASISLPVLPPIRGRVIDTEGRPVPNTAVGRWLRFDAGGTGEMLRFFDGAVALTDRDGNFVIAPKLELSFGASRPAPKVGGLCFADPSYRSEGWLLFHPNQPIRTSYQVFDQGRPVEPMTVTLKPSRRVRIPISRGFVMSKRKTEYDSTVLITLRKDIPHYDFELSHRFVKPTGESPTETAETVLEEYLPEGTYQLEVLLMDENSSETLGQARREIIVPRGEGSLVLPPLALEPTEDQKLVGKPAPEIAAIELDTGRPVRLADFRGKVVVVDFWGYWCGVCNVKMPNLVELDRKFAGRPLAILAIHDQSVQSRAAYDRKIGTVRERLWGGRDLPFRVLLDRPDPNNHDDLGEEGTGTTISRYSVTSFPSLFVIDRDGTMIGRVDPYNHDRLESLVRDLVEKAELVR